jgi:hypothetical protein
LHQKAEDYHPMLIVVLSPLSELQTFNGIDLDLEYKNTMYCVSLKIPILFVTGDSEGQDKLVGRSLQYSNLRGTKLICRYCNVTYDNTDNPYAKATPTKSSTIASYLQNPNKQKKLADIGYLNVGGRNVFHNLKFCDTELGLNGSVPADLLHTFQLIGIYNYMQLKVCSDKRKLQLNLFFNKDA